MAGIQLVRQVNSKSKPKAWSEAFRLLHKKDKVSISKITTVLTWYCKKLKKHGDLITNGNPEFIPIAYTGPIFRDKFEGLEGAMFRENQKKNPKSKIKVTVEKDTRTDEELRADPNCYLDDLL